MGQGKGVTKAGVSFVKVATDVMTRGNIRKKRKNKNVDKKRISETYGKRSGIETLPRVGRKVERRKWGGDQG